MKRFLAKVLGIKAQHLARGDTRVNYWREKTSRRWNWNCMDGNNEIVCSSNQGYNTEQGCTEGIENARDALATAFVLKKELA